VGSEYTPPRDKCLAGAEVTVDNAKTLLQSAKTLAEVGQYGPASSLIVLAGEEAFKAMTLLIRYKGLEIDDEMERWRTKMLSQHQPRHDVGTWMVLMKRLIDATVAGMEAYTEHYEENEEKAKEARMKVMTDRANQLLDDENEEVQQLQKEIDWWQNADELKQQGFYVDYGSQGWSSPNDLTQEDFIESKQVVEEAIDLASFAIESFRGMNQEEREEQAEKERQHLREMREIL
jgi:AbiV family abortive infection protein